MTPADTHVVTRGPASNGDVLTLTVTRLPLVPDATSHGYTGH